MLNPEIAVNRRPIDRLSRNPQLGALAAGVQPAVAKALAAAGTPIANILHGTILGHPLHAVVTDIPVGAWTVTALLDAIELAGGPANAGADAALAIGLAGAGVAAVSGWADWSDTSDDPRTLGMAHALLNSLAVGAYVTAFALRRAGKRRAGLLWALAGYAVVGSGAYLGGELAYGQLIGPKHTAEPIAPASDFTPVGSAAALADGQPMRADFMGIPVLISQTPAGIAAISAVCTHRGAPLGEGTFEDGCVRCPWHGSLFSLEDGHVIDGPAAFPQPRFEARVNGTQIELRALAV